MAHILWHPVRYIDIGCEAMHRYITYQPPTGVGGIHIRSLDPKQGERGKIDKFNKIRPIFEFFAKMKLGGLYIS